MATLRTAASTAGCPVVRKLSNSAGFHDPAAEDEKAAVSSMTRLPGPSQESCPGKECLGDTRQSPSPLEVGGVGSANHKRSQLRKREGAAAHAGPLCPLAPLTSLCPHVHPFLPFFSFFLLLTCSIPNISDKLPLFCKTFASCLCLWCHPCIRPNSKISKMQSHDQINYVVQILFCLIGKE